MLQGDFHSKERRGGRYLPAKMGLSRCGSGTPGWLRGPGEGGFGQQVPQWQEVQFGRNPCSGSDPSAGSLGQGWQSTDTMPCPLALVVSGCPHHTRPTLTLPPFVNLILPMLARTHPAPLQPPPLPPASLPGCQHPSPAPLPLPAVPGALLQEGFSRQQRTQEGIFHLAVLLSATIWGCSRIVAKSISLKMNPNPSRCVI